MSNEIVYELKQTERVGNRWDLYIYDIHIELFRFNIDHLRNNNAFANQYCIQEFASRWIKTILDDEKLFNEWLKHLIYNEHELMRLSLRIYYCVIENRLLTFEEFKPFYDKKIMHTLAQ